MNIKNSDYEILITVDEMYTISSVDNKPYDFVFNPKKMRRIDFTKVFSIQVENKGSFCSIALIGNGYSHVEECAILEQDRLIILMDDVITIIDLKNISSAKSEDIKRSGCNYAIHPFNDGYALYGELQITKLNKDFTIQWQFNANDIIVYFEIRNETIKFVDYSNEHYYLNKEGKYVGANDFENK